MSGVPDGENFSLENFLQVRNRRQILGGENGWSDAVHPDHSALSGLLMLSGVHPVRLAELGCSKMDQKYPKWIKSIQILELQNPIWSVRPYN